VVSGASLFKYSTRNAVCSSFIAGFFRRVRANLAQFRIIADDSEVFVPRIINYKYAGWHVGAPFLLLGFWA
jgi:hypothetical protein